MMPFPSTSSTFLSSSGKTGAVGFAAAGTEAIRFRSLCAPIFVESAGNGGDDVDAGAVALFTAEKAWVSWLPAFGVGRRDILA